ncbi:hypothetical protein [Enterococcus ratti]|uniref:hypothetical protein n=1 Tax=Enterococcus ratti TaxID=150033 RepID=UPI0008FFE7F6|nr:hypothetical protein [Enterococcus ratti]
MNEFYFHAKLIRNFVPPRVAASLIALSFLWAKPKLPYTREEVAEAVEYLNLTEDEKDEMKRINLSLTADKYYMEMYQCGINET